MNTTLSLVLVIIFGIISIVSTTFALRFYWFRTKMELMLPRKGRPRTRKKRKGVSERGMAEFKIFGWRVTPQLLAIIGVAVGTIFIVFTAMTFFSLINKEKLEYRRMRSMLIEIKELNEEFSYQQLYTGNLYETKDFELAKLVRLGLEAYNEYKYDEAIGYFKKSTGLTTDTSNLLALMNFIGASQWSTSDYNGAKKTFNEMMGLAESTENREALAVATGNLALVDQSLGNIENALKLHRSALEINQKLGNREGEAGQFLNLGMVYYTLGKLRTTLAYLDSALIIHKQLGDVKGQASDYSGIGLVYQSLGELTKALEFYQLALKIDRDIGNLKGQAKNLGNIGYAYYVLGELDTAKEYSSQALDIAEKIGDQQIQANQKINLGLVYYSLGESQKALEFEEEALRIAKEIGSIETQAQALGNIGVIYQDLGEQRKALEFYSLAFRINEQLGRLEGQAMQLNNMALIYQDLGDPVKALEFYKRALEISKEVGNIELQAKTLFNMGTLYADEGQLEVALSYYQQARDIFLKIGNAALTGKADENITHIRMRLEESRKKWEEKDTSKSGFSISGELSREDIVKAVMPPYPTWAKQKGLSNVRIAIQFQVDVSGNVLPTMIVTMSTGYPNWDATVKSTLASWKFKSSSVKTRTGKITFVFAPR